MNIEQGNMIGEDYFILTFLIPAIYNGRVLIANSKLIYK